MVAAGAVDEVRAAAAAGASRHGARAGARLRGAAARRRRGDEAPHAPLRQAPAHLDAQAARRPRDRRDRPRPRRRRRGAARRASGMICRRALREVAGAGQRLPDRRGGRAAVRAHPRARPAPVRPPHRPRRRRRARALGARTDAASSPVCGSSTPTAPRPSCRATAPARRSSTCAAAAGRTPTRSRSRPSPARSARRSPARTPAASTWAARRSPPPTSRPDPPTAAASSRPAGARGASSTWRSATRSARSASPTRPSSRRSTSPALGPADRARRAVPATARTCPSGMPSCDPDRVRARIFERGVGETLSSGTGACGAAVAHVLRGGDSPVTVHLDGGELEVDVGEDLRRRPHRLGRARVRGRAQPGAGGRAEGAVRRAEPLAWRVP